MKKITHLIHFLKDAYKTWIEEDTFSPNLSQKDWNEFPEYNVSGFYPSEFFIIPHTYNHKIGWLFSINGNGKLITKKQTEASPFAFRKYILPDGRIRYSYLQTERPMQGTRFALEYTHGVLLDEKMNAINNHITLLAGGSIKNPYPCENHEFLVLDDDHFILTSAKMQIVFNIDKLIRRPVRVFQSIIQEQKAGKVLWQFETADYPELYNASILNNDYEHYTGSNLLFRIATDYAHVNAVTVDSATKDFLVSFRNIGLVKISRETKKILWIMGRNRNDIQGMTSDEVPMFQHHVRYQKDGSFTVFDNYGCPQNYSRVCRYWIDEAAKTLVKFKEYRTEYPRSNSMGSAQLLDEENDTYLICYGGMKHDKQLKYTTADPAFEVYNFKERRAEMRFSFKLKYSCYQVQCGEEVITTL